MISVVWWGCEGPSFPKEAQERAHLLLNKGEVVAERK
jgi:hypothetical protein